MAQKYIVELVDDIDGKTLTEGDSTTLNFSVDGKNYAMDVSTKHAEEFHKLMDRYTSKARVQNAVAAAKSAVKRKSSSEDLTAVRSWARDNGFEVSNRGRIPATVTEAYANAHK